MVAFLALIAHAQEQPAPSLDLPGHLAAVGLVVPAYVEALRAAGTDPALRREAGELLWRGDELDLAAAHFRALPDDPGARLALAWTEWRRGAPLVAVTLLEGAPGPDAAYVRGFALAAAWRPADALAAWSEVEDAGDVGRHALAATAEVEGWRRMPHRSPGLAGGLSAVVPGLGQAYVGRWGEAASALVVNGAFVAGAVEFGRRELWAGTAVCALFGLGFYGGNVMSAVHGAKRFDRLQRERRMAALEARHAPTLDFVGEDLELVLPAEEPVSAR